MCKGSWPIDVQRNAHGGGGAAMQNVNAKQQSSQSSFGKHYKVPSLPRPFKRWLTWFCKLKSLVKQRLFGKDYHCNGLKSQRNYLTSINIHFKQAFSLSTPIILYFIFEQYIMGLLLHRVYTKRVENSTNCFLALGLNIFQWPLIRANTCWATPPTGHRPIRRVSQALQVRSHETPSPARPGAVDRPTQRRRHCMWIDPKGGPAIF